VGVDEDLTTLDDYVRRLKVEYDIYFGGGAKKPPGELEWRVKNLLKKFSDGTNLNFSQRFRLNSIQQRYALMSALWGQKLRIKEEGYRRPQDAALGIQGLRSEEEHAAEAALGHPEARPQSPDESFSIDFADVDAESQKVETLFTAFSEARKEAGEKTPGTLDSFKKFVRQKTTDIRKQYGCTAVEYSVEFKNGQAKLKAKPKNQ